MTENFGKDQTNQKTEAEVKEITKIREQELFDAYELIKDTVVVIKILRKIPVLIEDRVEIKEIVIGHGSGFIYNMNRVSFVFTAQHVISDLKKNERIQILLKQKDGQWITDNNVQVFFEDAEHDIAALFLSADANSLSSVELSKFVFNPSTLLKVGVRVTYCGFPYISNKGEFIPVFQQGMIAGIDTGRFKDNKFAYIIDGMVNPGNSGGPAFVGTGKEVIGIISAYIKPMLPGPRLVIIDGDETIDLLSRSAGLGLVVPVNYAVDRLRLEINKLAQAAESEKNKEAITQEQKQESDESQVNLKKIIASRLK